MADHVKDGMCAHCGGRVGDDGFAEEMADGNDLDTGPASSEQNESTEMMRDAAFINALKGGKNFSSTPIKDDPSSDAPKTSGDEEMMRKKRERYGSFGKKVA